jgi:hypothetical protein
LKAKQNKYDINLFFLGILRTLGPTAINQFYHALVITGQDTLAELLTESKNVTLMTETEKDAMLAKYNKLVVTMNKTK